MPRTPDDNLKDCVGGYGFLAFAYGAIACNVQWALCGCASICLVDQSIKRGIRPVEQLQTYLYGAPAPADIETLQPAAISHHQPQTIIQHAVQIAANPFTGGPDRAINQRMQ